MNKETWQEIHKLHAEGWSQSAIGRKLGIHRRSVGRALACQTSPKRAQGHRGSVLDGHFGFIKGLLEETPDLSAARVHALLKQERDLDVGMSTVREHIARLRPKSNKAYLTLNFAPGECAQVDWGTIGTIEENGVRRRLSLFVMVLCHSRLMYAELCVSEKMEYWLGCHRRAFEFLGGVPAKVMHDNLKTAVIRNQPGLKPEFNPAFLEFANCHNFEPVACTPYRPNQKGRVENAVGYVKNNFAKGRRLEHLESLREALKDWLKNTANCRTHGTTGRVPREVFVAEERPALLPLPLPYATSTVRWVQANSQFRVIVDTNRYSVPPKFASRRLQLHLYDDRVILYDGSRLVVDHPRCHGRKQDILKPEHACELIEQNRHGRHAKQLDTFLSLGEASYPYLEQLKERRPNWHTHVARINALAMMFGADNVHRAMRDAAAFNGYSSEYIYHLLSMRSRHEPEKSPLHVTRREDLLDLETPKPDLSIYNTPERKSSR